MRRTLATLLSALLLLLCAWVCVLWVRSYFVYDSPSLSDEGRPGPAGARDWGVWAMSCRGSLRLTAYRDRYFDADLAASQGRTGQTRWGWSTIRQRPSDWRAFEARARRNNYPNADNVNATIALPHAVWAVLLGFLPVRRAMRRRTARRRERLGLCLACGYDLRGSPGQCPECGRIAA